MIPRSKPIRCTSCLTPPSGLSVADSSGIVNAAARVRAAAADERLPVDIHTTQRGGIQACAVRLSYKLSVNRYKKGRQV